MTDLADPIPTTLVTIAPPRRRPWVEPAAVVLFLSALAWFAHFAGWRQVGFFSDDHSFALYSLAWTPADAVRCAQLLAFSYPEPQGRPLGFLLGLELPYLGYHIAGIFGMFAIGWLILSGNAVLLYTLLARRLPSPLPFVAALMFLLFPADTTRPFLCHAHILQPSLTFALVAAHLMLCRPGWRHALGYLVAALCLITYETAMLPLFAVPLLDWPLAASRNGVRSTSIRRFAVRFAAHVILLMTWVGIVALTRAHAGEYRAVGATGGKGTVLAQVALGSIIGPSSATQACLRQPWRQVVHVVHRPSHAAVIVGVSALFATTLRARRLPDRAAARRAVVFGAAAVAVSYLFCFTHYPPTCEEGQSTSVHMAAVIGFATLTAGGYGWLLLRFRRLATALAALYFGLLFGQAVDEQAGFATIWHERQSFWTQVLLLCPDLTDRTVILCDGTLPQPTWLMPGNLWSDAMVPGQVYRFPDAWRLPPMLAAYPRKPGEDWRSVVRRGATGRLVWRTPPCNCPAGQALDGSTTILLRLDGAGRVTRVVGPVAVAGMTFRFRPPPLPGTRPPFPKLPFYGLLVDGD